MGEQSSDSSVGSSDLLEFLVFCQLLGLEQLGVELVVLLEDLEDELDESAVVGVC